ncbi:MAG: hypothetical protein ACRDNI_03220 [Gaiellaceae bacterium]
MGPGPDDDSAGTTPLGGAVTGQVQAGRFVLEVGAPAGTRAQFDPAAAADSTPLRVALSQPSEPDAASGVEEAVGEAASVTSRVERALELFTAVAQGRILDRKILLKEVDVLIGALERLDREGRHREALRLGRALASLAALAMRWVTLVQSLRIALRAARAVGDAPAIAWARHELGTLFLGAEDAAAANSELREALRIREELGDEEGAEVTQHNLAVLRGTLGAPRPDGLRPAWIAAIVAGVLLLVAGGVAVALLLRDGDNGPPPADTTPPVVSFTETPDDPTEELSASFSFEADERVRTFECRLDDGAFEECVSPQNIPGPLGVGPHVFAVRAVDFADNVGEAAVHEWTIERGEGPVAVIVDGPAELTSETTATFTIEAPDAVRLECAVDGGDAQSCPTLVAFEVDEGEHVFEVRGFDASDTAGPPATHRWTVDTTGPEVTIDEVTFTNGLAVEVAFTPGEDGVTVECALLERTAVEEGEEEPEPRLIETQGDCQSPAVFDELQPETLYVARVTGTDAVGNVGEPDEEEFDTVADVE